MRRALSPATCLLAALALGIAGLAGCRKASEDGPDTQHVVATVNGQVLSRADFEKELARELASTEAPQRTPEEVEPFKRALLDTLLSRMLLLQAARQLHLAVTPDEVDRGLMRLSSDYPAGNFNDVLAQGQLSMAELRTKEADRLTIEKLFASEVYPRVAVTEEELHTFHAAHEEEFLEPEQVHAAQLVVKSLEEAKRVQAQLKAGKRFADLARKYSLSADAKVGGDLGFFPRGQMPPAFDEVVFNLREGQVSDIVETEYGYHLFRVLETRPARKPEFSEVRGEVEARLLARKRAEAQAAYEQELRAKAQVWVNEPLLQTLRGQAQPQEATQ